jgi:RNA-binding motif X-linked protein 2
LVRDKETGKSKGVAFVKYQDQRSTVLAVDNFNGATLVGRTLRVDHVRRKRQPKPDDDPAVIEERERYEEMKRRAILDGEGLRALFYRCSLLIPERMSASESSGDEQDDYLKANRKRQKKLRKKAERDGLVDGDEEDPMRAYLAKQERKKARKARKKEESKSARHTKRSDATDSESSTNEEARRRDGPRSRKDADSMRRRDRSKDRPDSHMDKRDEGDGARHRRRVSRSRSRSVDDSKRRRYRRVSRSPRRDDDRRRSRSRER